MSDIITRTCTYEHCPSPSVPVEYPAWNADVERPMHSCCVAQFLEKARLIEDQPSLDQIETANRILSRDMHPLRSGLPVLAHCAAWDRASGDYTLRIDVLEAADEIYASPRSYLFRIMADGTYSTASTTDLPTLQAR